MALLPRHGGSQSQAGNSARGAGIGTDVCLAAQKEMMKVMERGSADGDVFDVSVYEQPNTSHNDKKERLNTMRKRVNLANDKLGATKYSA